MLPGLTTFARPVASLAALAAVALGAYLWHAGQVDAFAEREASAARAESARAAVRIAESRIELQQQLLENERVAQREKTALAGLVARLADDKRLLESERAGFGARIAAATQAELRTYAARVDGDLTRSRNDVERFGVEAAQCASTAWQLRRDITTLTAVCDANLKTLGATP